MKGWGEGRGAPTEKTREIRRTWFSTLMPFFSWQPLTIWHPLYGSTHSLYTSRFFLLFYYFFFLNTFLFVAENPLASFLQSPSTYYREKFPLTLPAPSLLHRPMASTKLNPSAYRAKFLSFDSCLAYVMEVFFFFSFGLPSTSTSCHARLGQMYPLFLPVHPLQLFNLQISEFSILALFAPRLKPMRWTYKLLNLAASDGVLMLMYL